MRKLLVLLAAPALLFTACGGGTKESPAALASDVTTTLQNNDHTVTDLACDKPDVKKDHITDCVGMIDGKQQAVSVRWLDDKGHFEVNSETLP